MNAHELLLPYIPFVSPAVDQTILKQVMCQHIEIDQRNISTLTPHCIYIALLSQTGVDARLQYIQDAIDRGAVLVITEAPLNALPLSIPVIVIPELRKILGHLTRRLLWSGESDTSTYAAVTGTNGKTTICRLLAELVNLSGSASAVMGTTGNGILPHLQPSTHTTVDAVTLQKQLHLFSQQHVRCVALEASSHGLHQGRLQGTPIHIAIYSNLSRDHLDYHPTMDDYFAAKAMLFSRQQFPDLRYAIVNIDDAYGQKLADSLRTETGITLWRYSSSAHATPHAEFKCTHTTFSLSGAVIHLVTPWGECVLHSPLLGQFNVANVIAAFAGALAIGLPLNQAIASIPLLRGAEGRMQTFACNNKLAIVDYAHTPDAVKQVLSALKVHAQGHIFTVLGCGGNRDKGKRPDMLAAALAQSTHVIVTADNPRNEAVEDIINDMLEGIDTAQRARVTIVEDRKQAIEYALHQCATNDMVLIAGKGHETYQEIKGVRHPFSDAMIVKDSWGL